MSGAANPRGRTLRYRGYRAREDPEGLPMGQLLASGDSEDSAIVPECVVGLESIGGHTRRVLGQARAR